MRVEVDLHQLVRNQFGLQYLNCGLATQETGSSFLSQLEPDRLRYLGCGLAAQETGGSFLSQLELVRLTLPWLWTGHMGDRWLLP
jgi:hypothetical protein